MHGWLPVVLNLLDMGGGFVSAPAETLFIPAFAPGWGWQ